MSTVIFVKRGAVGHIELNRADKLHAINSEMLDGLVDVLDAVKVRVRS